MENLIWAIQLELAYRAHTSFNAKSRADWFRGMKNARCLICEGPLVIGPNGEF